MNKVFSLMGELAIDGVSEAQDDLKDVAKEGKKTEQSLAKSFSEMGQKAGELGRNMALGLAGAVTGAVAMVEGTRELRQDLGKLETAFETTGQATGMATETFKTLYGIIGEDDTSIEAANHLAQLTNNEKDLSQWTDILTGVYATFGDSLPLEGLAEASNETVRVGQVTGGLADAINWASASGETFGVKLKASTKANEEWNKAVMEATSAEDFFNLALQECNTEAEREKLIRETLTGLYGEASNTYKEVNGDLIAGNEAQADMNLKMAEMSEKLQPLITKGKVFLMEVLNKISPFLNFIIDNINVLAPIVIGFISTLFALNIASKITAFIPIVKTLFATLSANPIGLIIMAIGLLITAFVTLWNNCEGFRNFWIGLWENIKIVFKGFVDGIQIWIEAIVGFFKGLWENVKAVFDGIVKAISIALQLIASIMSAAVQIITLPFRFIWENCKEYVFTAFEYIKKAISKAIDKIKEIFNALKSFFSKILNEIKSVFTTVWNAIKNFLTPIFNAIKDVATKVWNAIKNTISNVVNGIKTTVTNVFNSVKSTVSSVFNGIKSVATSVWNGIKSAITKPIEKARDVVKGVVDKIKGFFNFKIELPKIKLPRFSIKPSGWKLGDLLQGSIPKLGIDWYAKAMNNPMLLEDPTAFGFSPSGNIRVGGEAGSELVGGASTIMGMISDAVRSNNGGIEGKLDRLISLLTNYLPMLSNQQVVLSTGELVGAMVNPMDKALGDLASRRGRGY